MVCDYCTIVVDDDYIHFYDRRANRNQPNTKTIKITKNKEYVQYIEEVRGRLQHLVDHKVDINKLAKKVMEDDDFYEEVSSTTDRIVSKVGFDSVLGKLLIDDSYFISCVERTINLMFLSFYLDDSVFYDKVYYNWWM